MGQKRIDLNLLNVFSAVMVERSVTRAADRLSMTQPAVSNALGRLRLLFRDELFVKSAGGITPTERAKAIWQGIRRPMEELRSVAVPSEFHAATTAVTFNLAITDTLLSRVVPRLTTRVMHEAPTARLNFHFHSNPSSVTGLETGALDCAVGMFPSFSADIIVEGVAVDEYVCVFSANHSTFGHTVSLEQFLAAKHVVVKQSYRQLGMVDSWISLLGLERDIVATVNASSDGLDTVRKSDLIVAVPQSYFDTVDQRGLRSAPLPFPHDHIFYRMAWHERTDRDPARIWLRSMVRQAVMDVISAPSLGMPSQQVARTRGEPTVE